MTTITYNGKKYDEEIVRSYYDMGVTNYDDLGAETAQEFFDEYIKLDPEFVTLFDYDIDPVEREAVKDEPLFSRSKVMSDEFKPTSEKSQEDIDKSKDKKHNISI